MMLSVFRTETVTFITVNPGGVSDEGSPIVVRTEVEVPGCLVQPSNASEMGEGYQYHQQSHIIVHIPKSFSELVVGGEVICRGERYQIVRSPERLAWSPLAWDREVLCRRVS